MSRKSKTASILSLSVNYQHTILALMPLLTLSHSLSSCSQHEQNTMKHERFLCGRPEYYIAEFSKLPAEQRKDLRELFLNEFYRLSVTPIPKNYVLDNHNLTIWKKAQQQGVLPNTPAGDWRAFFIVYDYGMWIDIFETLKNNPEYMSGKAIIALCHYVTVLQFSNDCKPTEYYFTDERLRELKIYNHPSPYSVYGVYSVRR